MAAPTITRPPASVVEESKNTSIPPEWAIYIKWTMIGAFALALVALVAAMITSMSESSRTAKARAQWDELYSAVHDVNRDEDRIAPLEKLAESDKIKGTPVHGFVLTQLASQFFKMAQNEKSALSERNEALKRAEQLYTMLETTSPFKENSLVGPAAVHNLALVYEQGALNDKDNTQSYDSAIKTLRTALFNGEGKDAPAIPSMQAHFLFNPMQAQLGRLYWMRGTRTREIESAKLNPPKPEVKKEEAKPGEKKDDKKDEKKDEKKEELKPVDPSIGKADFERAYHYVSQALLAVPSKEESDSGKAAWRIEASYIKSLLEKPGVMLADGKVPPVKEEKKEEPKKEEPKAGEKKDEAKPAAKPAEPAKKDEAKPAEPAKKDDAKPADKKEESKKEEPKKTSSVDAKSSAPLADEPLLPAQHLTYAQMQQLLKQGKPAFCQCPRCTNGDRAVGAKLAE